MSLNNQIQIYKDCFNDLCITKLKKVSIFSGIAGLLFSFFAIPAVAQQHSYDPNTNNDGGKQAYDCREDIRRFCDRLPGILLFEQENCLESHMDELKPVCRQHLSSTDFRKYYQSEAHPLGF
ncbi:MAG: hypothetical protein FJX39_03515 [Alphaproteobacteria bacterium]|nr:hypothetical protein [Alphaproteobacteria bacterium]